MRQHIKSAVLIICMMVLTVNGITDINIDYGQVAEDVEIMSALVDKTLEGKFPNEYRASSMFRGFRGCQGIYLKGYGVVFITSIDFPVAQRAELQEEVPQDDEWQRTKYELRGIPGGVLGSRLSQISNDYNPGKVEELKGQLLKLIGTYGSNIRQLSSQESVAIAIRGTSGPVTIRELKVVERLIGSDQLRKGSEELQEKVKLQAQEIEKKAKELKDKAKVEQGEELQEKVKLQMQEIEKKAKELEDKAKVEQSKELQEKVKLQTQEIEKKAEQLQKIAKEIEDKANLELQSKMGELRNNAEILQELALKRELNAFAPTPLSMIGGMREYTTMIIKASMDDISAYKSGKLDFDGFMKRAEITQY